jgi:putative phage-type endonuclease
MSTELLDQRSDAWVQARIGSLGASSLHEALAKTAKGWGASRAQIMSRLAVERLTGKPVERFENQAMRDGTAREPEAADAYAFRYDVDLEECGLFKHPTIIGTHASPDRLIADTGLVEIKSPTHATHLESLLGAPIPQKYQLQIAWQLCCTGRTYCDFVSYHPDFPEAMRLHVTRVQRNDKHIAELEAQVREFLHELQMKLVELTARYGAPMREAA